MNDTPLGGFFGVVTRPRTWLNLLFQIVAFPLGLFYFVFLVTGLSVGLGLVIIWVGIPILLVVAGAWWLFGAFERFQARVLLGATVPDAPRSWETVDGIWGKVKAHFGNGATWKDLLYLLAKLAFGVVSFTLVVTLASIIAWLFALPFSSAWNVGTIDFGSGPWVPPMWLGVLGIPAAVVMIFASLHVLNAWGWVCKRWAEVMFRVAPQAPAAVVPPTPLVSTSPQQQIEPGAAATWPAPSGPPVALAAPVAPAPPAPPDPPVPAVPVPPAPAPELRPAAPALGTLPEPAAPASGPAPQAAPSETQPPATDDDQPSTGR